MKKTNRKNKTKLEVTWPSNEEFFTVNTLKNNNSSFEEITLRVWLKKALESGLATEIGQIPNGKGRPKNAYVMCPVSNVAIEKAKESGVLLHTKYATVDVLKIDATEVDVESDVQSNESVDQVIEDVQDVNV